ncbi:class I SAM-dependent methyltransferase [Streptomyces sp. NPDC059718]
MAPPPWGIGQPQDAFLALAKRGVTRGRVQDVGCGTGEHTLMAAGLGLDATCIDLAAKALRSAEDKARDRGLRARFLHHDARLLADLGERFETVLDFGLFHIFEDQDRAAYTAGLRSAVPAGGRYFMLGLSDRQPGEGRGRMRKPTQEEIRAAFAEGWHADSIEAATIHITTDPGGIRAWRAGLTRI